MKFDAPARRMAPQNNYVRWVEVASKQVADEQIHYRCMIIKNDSYYRYYRFLLDNYLFE